jgi:hypothetical protein
MVRIERMESVRRTKRIGRMVRIERMESVRRTKR